MRIFPAGSLIRMDGRGPMLAAKRGTDADAALWSAAVVTAGGTVSATRLALVSSTIAALKASGDWNNIDDLMMYAAENATQGLVSWKRRLLGTLNGTAPTFTTDRCVIPDGITGYIDTLFNPSTHATASTGSDQMIGVYEVTNLSGATYAAGLSITTTAGLRVGPRNLTTMLAQANCTATSVTLGVADSRGLKSAYRTASTFGAAANGVSQGTFTPAGNTTALLAKSVWVGGARTNADTLATPRATNLGYMVLGGSAVALSVPFYNAMQAHMTAIGGAV